MLLCIYKFTTFKHASTPGIYGNVFGSFLADFSRAGRIICLSNSKQRNVQTKKLSNYPSASLHSPSSFAAVYKGVKDSQGLNATNCGADEQGGHQGPIWTVHNRLIRMISSNNKNLQGWVVTLKLVVIYSTITLPVLELSRTAAPFPYFSKWNYVNVILLLGHIGDWTWVISNQFCLGCSHTGFRGASASMWTMAVFVRIWLTRGVDSVDCTSFMTYLSSNSMKASLRKGYTPSDEEPRYRRWLHDGNRDGSRMQMTFPEPISDLIL